MDSVDDLMDIDLNWDNLSNVDEAELAEFATNERRRIDREFGLENVIEQQRQQQQQQQQELPQVPETIELEQQQGNNTQNKSLNFCITTFICTHSFSLIHSTHALIILSDHNYWLL